jgi:hypothetical protein
MGKIRRGPVFARNKRKMRHLLRRLEGRKGPGVDLLD